MKLKFNIFLLLFIVFSLFSYQKTFAQCFQIESILVAACTAPVPAPQTEGLNEMVRFQVGNSSLDAKKLTVDWPTNTVANPLPWLGVIQNTTTATKVTQLNADILASGGAGKLLEPPGGIIPANAKVILVTSYNMDTVLNSFGALADTIYIIFQNNPTRITGHFSNTKDGTITMSFSGTGGCSHTVSYEVGKLVKLGGKTVGATVNYAPSGTPTYVNNGCVAPVEVFTVDAGTTPISGCPGATVSLSGTAQGQQSVAWSAPSGSFSAPTSLFTDYTIDPSATGTIVLTLEATNASGTKISDTVTLNITPGVTPTFNAIPPVCQNAIAPVLPLNSTNSPAITGSWSPSVNTATEGTATYTFTPNPNQCATQTTLPITVNLLPIITPTPNSNCGAGTVTLGATTSAGTISWFAAAAGGTALATGTSFTTPTISTSTSYWVEATSGSCTTNPRMEVIATITSSGAIPKPTVKTPVEYCLSTTTPASPLTATTTVPGATLNWYATLTSTPALASAPIPNITTVSSATYYVSQSVGGCEGPREVIAVSVIGDTNVIATNFRCDPSQATVANSVFFDWTNVVGRTGYYKYSYSINGGALVFDSTFNGESSEEVFGVSPGQKVEFTILEVQGVPCFKPQTISCSLACTTTTVPDFPSIPATQSICTGSTAPVLPPISNNGISGTWLPATFSNTTTGTYEFTPDAILFPCASTVKKEVVVTPKVTPTFAPTTTSYCQNAFITLPILPTTSSNSITGTWNPASISTSALGTIVHDFTPSTGSCAISTSISITVNANVTPTFNTIGSICKGNNIILPTTSINNITGSWLPAFNPLATTTYTFIPDAGQCATSTPINQIVTIIQLPVATNTTGPTSICSGVKTFINLGSDISGTTFTWNVIQTNAVGAAAGTGTKIEPNLTAVSNKSGEAVYSITPNNNGCKGASIEVAITVNPIPDVKDNTEKSTICSGTTTNISLTSGVVGTTYTWTVNATPNVLGALPGNGNLIQQELSTNGLTQGSVVYTITPDSNGCPGSTIDVTITVDPLPDGTALVAKNPICSGEATKIDLSSIIGASFNWTVIQTGVTGATKGTGASIEQTLQAGTVAGIAGYIITPILNGCEGTPNPVIINVNPLPVAVIQEDGLLCIRKDGTVKSSFILNTNLSDADYDFVWYKDNAVIPPPFPPLLPPTNSYEVTEIGDYYVAVTNKLTTCYAESNSALITSISPADYIDPPIVTDAFTDDATVIINVFPPADYYLYQMDFDPLQDLNEFTQIKGGSHIIRVTDAIGCTDLSSPARVISYPKFFTPNGDGYNDTWNIIDLGDQPNAKLYIFDRHGKLLKQVSTFGNGWDGTYNGKQLPASDYWFSLNYFENDVLKLFKSHFSLKR